MQKRKKKNPKTKYKNLIKKQHTFQNNHAISVNMVNKKVKLNAEWFHMEALSKSLLDFCYR